MYFACDVIVSFFYTSGASFLSSFISAARKQEKAAMIEMCGKIEVKKATFEAVKVETHESLEFLKVSHPVNYFQYKVGDD